VIATTDSAELRRLLTEAESALRELAKKCLVVKTSLDTPYPEAPDRTPWTQYVQRPASRAYNLAVEIRRALRGPETVVLPSNDFVAPETQEGDQ
jgi:hypothetical protein